MHTNFRNQLDQRRQALEGNCPYCYSRTSELSEHLQSCEVYESILQSSSGRPLQMFGAESVLDLLTDSEEEYFPSLGYLNSSQSSLEIPHSPEMSPSRKSDSIVTGASCPVCFNFFRKNVNIPLVLPVCGHTICSHCIRHMSEDPHLIKCPVCRKLNFKEEENLPINYALLDLAEKKNDRCQLHSLELVGYCKEHDMLLCGACVFEHKNHDIFALTDKKIHDVIEDKKKNIEFNQKKLLEEKSKWDSKLNALNQQYQNAEMITQTHIDSLINAEYQLVTRIKNGTKACIAELKQNTQSKEFKQLQNQMLQQIELIKDQLRKLKDKKKKFNELPIAERLSKVETVEFNNSSIPALELKTPLQLASNIDYESAIQNQSLNIFHQ